MRLGSVFAIAGICMISYAPTTMADEYKQCGAQFDQCLKACDDQHGTDTAGRAACVPTCSGKYAACDAGVAYDKAKPWIEEQAGKTKKFFEDLVDQLKKDPDAVPPETPDGPTEKSI